MNSTDSYNSKSLPPGSIAVLANDPAVVPFLELLLQKYPQSIAGIFSPGEGLVPAGKADYRVAHWEQWLAEPSVRWIVVCGETSEILDATRQLVAVGKSVLIYPRMSHELSLAYELSLAADQNPLEVIPAWLIPRHPAMRRIRDSLSRGEFGEGVHVQLERQVVCGQQGTSRLMTEAQLEGAWLEDGDVLLSLCGSFDQLTCTRGGVSAQGIALSQIIVNRLEGAQGVWSCRSGEQPSWKLSVSGEKGLAHASLHADPQSIEWDLAVQGKEPQQGTDTADYPTLILAQLEDAFDGKYRSPRLADLIKAYELVDGARRSLKRRRTIDLYGEPPTERGHFKTQMTALGCGVLMYVLFAIPAFMGLASLVHQVGLPDWVLRVLRVLLFAPLGIFLALQLLLLFARSGREENTAARSGREPNTAARSEQEAADTQAPD
ncbi:MAG: hypothetical protein U0903_00775 [Planctomycetales bacterium]